MFSDGLTVLGFDSNGSNSAQGSSLSEEYNDSRDDFSANKSSTSKKMAQNIVFRVHMAPEEAFEQGHVIDKKYPPNKHKISIIEITTQFFISFLHLKTLCALQDKL